VRNGFAFARIDSLGTVWSWGEAAYGGAGAPSTARDAVQVVGSRFSFAAVQTDGSVVVWGLDRDGLGSEALNAINGGGSGSGSLNFSTLVANEAAYAGIATTAGGVVSFGSTKHGGNVRSSAINGASMYDTSYNDNGYSLWHLSANITSITASAGAFAALTSEGRVVVWGNPHAGGIVSSYAQSLLPPHEVGSNSNNTSSGSSNRTAEEVAVVKNVVATRAAFAALLSNGRVVTWGDAMAGGNVSTVASAIEASPVVHIVASTDVFLAFQESGAVVTWGYSKYGGDSSDVAASLTSQVAFVAHTYTAFAALKTDGGVVTWGKSDGGGDSSAVQHRLQNVTMIYASGKAFAALTAVGGVVTWGRSKDGGEIPPHLQAQLNSGVVAIYSTDRAFAALKTDGSVLCWGAQGHGGDCDTDAAAASPYLTSDVYSILSNDAAFSAIKTDGSVVGWGHPTSIPQPGWLFANSSLGFVNRD